MVVTSIDRIKDVVISVDCAQRAQERQMYIEYERSSKWLSEVAMLIKRKMMESCSLERAVKKLKLTKISEEDEENAKENCNPIDSEVIKCNSNKNFHQPYTQDTNDLSKYVSNMTVADLRSELRSRGLATYGLKRDLQDRLLEAIRDHKAQDTEKNVQASNVNNSDPLSPHIMIFETSTNSSVANDHPTVSSKESYTTIAQQIQEQPICVNLITKGTETTSNDAQSQKNSTIRTEITSTKETEVASVTKTNQSELLKNAEVTSSSVILPENTLATKVSEQSENSSRSPMKICKATSKIFSPSKSQVSSKDLNSLDLSVKSTKVEIDEMNGTMMNLVETTSIQTTIDKVEKEHISTVAGQGNNVINIDGFGTNMRKSNPTERMESNESRSVNGNCSDVSGSSSQSSLVLEKSKALAEARKARLAEMREKTKTAAVIPALPGADNKMTSTTSYCSSLPASTMLRPQPTQDTNEERKKALAAQMREKAAAQARKLAEENAKVAASEDIHMVSSISNSCSIKSPTTYPRDLLTASAKKKLQKHQAALSPMDTYDMSDREESGSDDDDDDDGRKKDKRIPAWAQKTNLIPALERQFLDGPDRTDPDNIFPEVSTCDLEAIFDQTKARYVKRTSSGNWTKDRVTASETLVYKRNMGFK